MAPRRMEAAFYCVHFLWWRPGEVVMPLKWFAVSRWTLSRGPKMSLEKWSNYQKRVIRMSFS